MATTLSAQLAQIRSQSTNPLDLKAQKKAHSQSLLYNPQVAGSQDFDTIYQLCYDGFEDLCRLDSHFLGFAGTLFSEQSKSQDRTQMTLAQNKELDFIVEDFLCLLSKRLALKPALKALEWIIRRFRAHENNTLRLVLAFLPYHDTPMFTTLLSLLPSRLPQQIKFLHPYTQSLANPSRHTIVYGVSNSKPLLASLSQFVLKCCEGANQFPSLVSLWASTTTEATVTMLDQARSARREAQTQNEEDTMIFILPILNAAFVIKDAPDLHVGCYMILSVLASKARLGEDILTAMMEAVVSSWEADSRAGLICLAVLAEKRHQHKLPRKVFKTVISLPNLKRDLIALHAEYQVNKLVLGIVTGLIKNTEKTGEVGRLNKIEDLLDASIIDEESASVAIGSLLSAVARSYAPEQISHDMRGQLCDLIFRLAKSPQIGNLLLRAVNESELELGQLRSTLESLTNGLKTKTLTLDNGHDMDIDEDDAIRDFDSMATQFTPGATNGVSFLTDLVSNTYNDLAENFCVMPLNTANLARFSDLPVLQKPDAMSKPLFMSFYIRVWCSSSLTLARAAALRTMRTYFTEHLKNEALHSDVQMLFPFLIYALSDPSPSVRSVAADIILLLCPEYVKNADAMDQQLNKSQIYGVKSRSISWLSSRDSRRLLEEVLCPHLEECLLDEQAILRLLPRLLNGSQTKTDPKPPQTELSKRSRLSTFTFLCDHVVNSPLCCFQLRMLRVLNKIEETSSTPRTKLLLPLLFDVREPVEIRERTCEMQKVNFLDLLAEITKVVSAKDEEGILALKHIVESDDFEPLQSVAFDRIKTIWPRIKGGLQLALADTFLDLAVPRNSGHYNLVRQAGATGTLRSVRLSSPVLHHLLNGLPMLTSQTEEPAVKRRRTDDGNSNIDWILSNHVTEHDIRKLTFFLELIDASKTDSHTILLQGLFQLLSDLKNVQGQAKTALGYLQVLVMDCMLSILKASKTPIDIPVDAATIKVDVLIDHIRTTESPQIRNAALLLVAKLCDIAPERVLHSIMPIFMYMGANLLRQEDEFSVYVVQQTMDSVIPRLVQSLHRNKKKAFAGVSELLINFVAAFEHIPQQRRSAIFSALVNKVGSADYLFALLVIISDRYSGNKKALQLCLDLLAQSSLDAQLRTIKKYLQVVLDIWESDTAGSVSAVLLDRATSPENRTLNLLPLLIAVFGSKSVKLGMRKMLKGQASDIEYVRTSISAILELIFLLSQHCKSNGRLHSLCMRMMDSFLQTLPSSELVQRLDGLLDRESEALRKQILQSFAHHLNLQKNDDKASRESSLAFVPRLLSILQESTDSLLKRMAVSAIDQVADKYGKVDSTTVIEAARLIADGNCLYDEDALLRAASLLCLSTMVEVSGEAIVPIVPVALPKVFKNLDSSIEGETLDANVHNACYSVLLALLIYTPWVTAGANLERLLTLSHKSAAGRMGDDCDETRTEALHAIAGRIGVKEILSALIKTWPSAVSMGPQAVLEHIQILQIVIEKQPKSILMQQTEVLGDMLLQVFSLRQIQFLALQIESCDTEDKISEAESLINKTAIAMISKLNDTTFRPLFQRLHTWSTTPEKSHPGRLQRQITWYPFLTAFFSHFKSIVTNYTAFILPDLLSLLETLRPTAPDSASLWQKALETIRTTCDHDQDNFHSLTQNFTPLSNTLASLLSHPIPLPQLTLHLIPALTSFAATTSSPAQQKSLNALLLTHLRSPTASTRLAAVKAQRSILARAGEEWVAECLPEMLPVIAEVVEDDDEDVEREGLGWVKELEEVLGESLDGMLH